MKYRNFEKVVQCRMCVGCGACVPVCPKRRIILRDILKEGIRPVPNQLACGFCGECVKVCPGLDSSIPNGYLENSNLKGRAGILGPYLELWEGYASDKEIRIKGSSGGIISALSCFALEKLKYSGVIHAKADTKNPTRNLTVNSQERQSVLEGTGSRYAPASPCELLGELGREKNLSVFVGKPCDVVGARKYIKQQSLQNVDNTLILGFFCAGTPATLGTVNLLNSAQIDIGNIKSLRYRGDGWPGTFRAVSSSARKHEFVLTYEESWDYLQRYRPFRCHLCPDGTAQMADLSLGDAWYRKPDDQSQGYSLIIVRTPKGSRILQESIKEGYISAERVELSKVLKSQSNLLNKRRAVWGRIFSLRSLGLPTPKYHGYFLFNQWMELHLMERIRSIVGTYKRIIRKKLYRPLKIEP